jgi:hypothetical protein
MVINEGFIGDDRMLFCNIIAILNNNGEALVRFICCGYRKILSGSRNTLLLMIFPLSRECFLFCHKLRIDLLVKLVYTCSLHFIYHFD